MHALSIRQPFAALLAAADPRVGWEHVKRAEFRGIAPAHVVGERIALQAAKADHELAPHVRRLLGPVSLAAGYSHVYSARQAVVATARVAGFERAFAGARSARLCVSERLDDDQVRTVLRLFTFDGQWAWRLDDVVALPRPVRCNGALGLWTLPAAAAHEVCELEALARDQGPLVGVSEGTRQALAASAPRQGRLL